MSAVHAVMQFVIYIGGWNSILFLGTRPRGHSKNVTRLFNKSLDMQSRNIYYILSFLMAKDFSFS